ncbi:MAG: prolyl-tRNA synthetase associated domain-containing protein [Hyphomicrobiales bacterium]
MITTRDAILAKLDELGIVTTTYDHEAVFTVEESEKLHDQIPGGHTKNLFVKDKKGKLFLLVVGAHATIDMKTLHKKLECARLSFGKPDLLQEKLGITPGSVNAFCIINDENDEVSILFDKTLMTYDQIACHPMTNTATTVIGREDLERFVKSTNHEVTIMALAEPAGE